MEASIHRRMRGDITGSKRLRGHTYMALEMYDGHYQCIIGISRDQAKAIGRASYLG